MVRLKNRYLLVDVSWKDDKLDESFMKHFSPYSGCAVVRCATSELDKVVGSMALMTDVRQRAAAVRVLRVSGTLAACKAAALEHSAARLARARLGKQQQQAAAAAAQQQLAAMEL
ncbi:hypothetical protein GPECTOR_56g422 [Gonium pectorale]|uniref:Uncharacterized protein n=1 Tax=Gonium pectorale TaxID=33097 RepID=A0A150G706_GONPE|nr:hypothetical protein GPECTOR_56g422 [Gonium pectorale]|eukprot:KXZ45325.1 hypothetical protein GPECTOR_56g422 [Gonium pectorale]